MPRMGKTLLTLAYCAVKADATVPPVHPEHSQVSTVEPLDITQVVLPVATGVIELQ